MNWLERKVAGLWQRLKPPVTGLGKFQRLAPEDQAYVDGLADKFNSGTLTDEDVASLSARRHEVFNRAIEAGQDWKAAREAVDKSGPWVSQIFIRAKRKP